jgi:hypothetical protein
MVIWRRSASKNIGARRRHGVDLPRWIPTVASVWRTLRQTFFHHGDATIAPAMNRLDDAAVATSHHGFARRHDTITSALSLTVRAKVREQLIL